MFMRRTRPSFVLPIAISFVVFGVIGYASRGMRYVGPFRGGVDATDTHRLHIARPDALEDVRDLPFGQMIVDVHAVAARRDAACPAHLRKML
jgi:hypothetical protein